MLPVSVSAAFSSRAFGFSGSRSVVPPALSLVLSELPGGAAVLVGCARGVDGAVRSRCSGASVFRVSGRGRGAFAARSVRFVQALSARGGVLFSFPGRACPAGLVPSACPSQCFCGSGSGSWASLALAVGLGVPCLVWLPAGVFVPAGWGFLPVGRGWYEFLPF